MDKDGLIPPGCGDPCTPATPGRSGETIDVMGLVRGMYYVRVFGAQDADTDYTLRVKVTAGGLCREDFTEEVQLPFREADVFKCAEAIHKWCFNHPGGNLRALAEFQNNDFDLVLRNEAGVALERADSNDNVEECMEGDRAAGRYCIDVILGSRTYTISIDDQACPW